MSKRLRSISTFLGRIASIRKGSGPYRFLVRQCKGLSDIDLAIGALDTQFFDRTLVPMPLPVEQLRSILVLAPHQDDEAIGARVHHLKIDNARLNPNIDDLDRLSRKINQLNPQVLLVPWLLDTAKHRMVNHMLWLAGCRFSLPSCEVWGYQVHNSLIPNGYIDISEVAEEKWKILKCYVSQNQHVRRYDHLAKGMAAWNCRFLPDYKGDQVARYVEIFCALPLHEHLKLIESFYFKDLDVTYRGMDLADGMKEIHRIAVDRLR